LQNRQVSAWKKKSVKAEFKNGLRNIEPAKKKEKTSELSLKCGMKTTAEYLARLRNLAS